MAPEEMEENDSAEAPEEGNGKKNYWWLALAVIFLLLAGGGFYALTSVSKSAHKLAGGANYDQFASNDDVYSGRSSAARHGDDAFSAGDEQAVREAAAAAAADKAAKTGDKAAAASAGGRRGAGASSSGGSQPVVYSDEEQAAERGEQAQRGSQAASAEAKLQDHALPGHGKVSPVAKGRNFGAEEAFRGGLPSGKPSVQHETLSAAKAKRGGAGGVLDALKGAFRASLYGARIASQDSAKSWISRQFDGSAEAEMALEYDEKMKAKLDRVNPNSIPQFLRDQDISAAEAKTLTSPEVGKPKMDVEGTKEALKNDKDYQAKKLAKDMYSGAVNPMGSFFSSSGGNTAGDGTEGTAGDDSRAGGASAFADPEDQASFGKLALDEYVSVEGYGKECGCTQEAPCCCLPQNTTAGSCPLYGPFLPNDPCGNYGGASIVGDFPPSNMSTMPV